VNSSDFSWVLLVDTPLRYIASFSDHRTAQSRTQR